MSPSSVVSIFFFFIDTATTEIYTLSLHDALPIFRGVQVDARRTAGSELRTPARQGVQSDRNPALVAGRRRMGRRSPRKIGRAHVELQSQSNLVCRLLLEKKKKKTNNQQLQM